MLVLLAAGETIAERDKIFLGQGDSPFTPAGLDQNHDAAETLAHYDFDHIYSSDLYRAQETLRAVVGMNKHRPTWELVEGLRERSGGSYEGMAYTDIRVGMSPKQYKSWERDAFEAPLHGESLADIEERLQELFTQLTSRLSENQSILIISHPDTIRVLIAMARGDELLEYPFMTIEHGIPYFYHGTPR